MQIVIDIPEEKLDYIKKDYPDMFWSNDVRKAILNGKPIDLDGLRKDMRSLMCGYPFGLDYLLKCMENRLGFTLEDCLNESSD